MHIYNHSQVLSRRCRRARTGKISQKPAPPNSTCRVSSQLTLRWDLLPVRWPHDKMVQTPWSWRPAHRWPRPSTGMWEGFGCTVFLNRSLLCFVDLFYWPVVVSNFMIVTTSSLMATSQCRHVGEIETENALHKRPIHLKKGIIKLSNRPLSPNPFLWMYWSLFSIFFWMFWSLV